MDELLAAAASGNSINAFIPSKAPLLAQRLTPPYKIALCWQLP
jgi:hypothetical protein